MKKDQVVRGTITIEIKIKDTFPSTMEEEQMIEYIENNYKDYIDEDMMKLVDTEIDSIETDSYGSDDYYDI